MLKVLHAADLHLTAGGDREYSLSVLRALVAAANARGADFLLLCGDLFDTFRDAADHDLLAEVREILGVLRQDCRVLYIPGNHEALGRGAGESLAKFDLGRLELCCDAASPWGGRLVEAGEAQFLCVPHAADYTGFRSWNIPAKPAGAARVLLMHGLNSAVYSGPDPEEEKAALIPDSLLSWAEADYAALGHVHCAGEALIGGRPAAYPGSARVWRAGETGPRKALYFEIAGGLVGPRQDAVLAEAGQYREFELPLDPDASVPAAAMRRLLEACPDISRDYVRVEFRGFVDNANDAEDARRLVENALRARLPRRLETDLSGLRVLGGLAANALAREFLEKLDLLRPPAGEAAEAEWAAARRLGLEALAAEKLE
jgi:DNA repair protein SbcD/Mre11